MATIDIAWLQDKSPKNWVTEVVTKRKGIASWDTVPEHPDRTPPIFVSICSVSFSCDGEVFSTKGRGMTKKEAEKVASLEMLMDKLQVTPENLQSYCKAKSQRVQGDVSDTDESELSTALKGLNPVSELTIFCSRKGYGQPDFRDVRMEGPSHDPKFTVECVVTQKERVITARARRINKKYAKRIAAYRVLRQLTEPTRWADSRSTELDDVNATVVKVLPSGEPIKIDWKDDLATRFNNFGMTDKPPKESMEENHLGEFSNRGTFGEWERIPLACREQFDRGFDNLKKSETMKSLMGCLESTCKDFNGPWDLLLQICQESGLRLHKSWARASEGAILFLKIKFPQPTNPIKPVEFNKSKFSLGSNSAVVHGCESDREGALEKAATAALKLMIDFYI